MIYDALLILVSEEKKTLQKYQTKINFLVDESWRIAKHILRVKAKNYSKIIYSDHSNIDDIAIMSITPLFLPAENGSFELLEKSFLNWQPKIDNEDEAIFFLHQIIGRNVNQQLSAMLKENDPFFSKIFNSVSYIIKKNNYASKSFCGRVYIVRSEAEAIHPPFISNEEFDLIPPDVLFNNEKDFEAVFCYIEEYFNCCPAIPKNEIVQRIKHAHTAAYSPLTSQIFSLNDSVENYVEQGLNFTFAKLSESYVKRSKLSANEAEGMKSVLMIIAEEMKNGGASPVLYEYFKLVFSDVSKEEFRRNYKNIFEYLVQTLHDKIAELLEAGR